MYELEDSAFLDAAVWQTTWTNSLFRDWRRTIGWPNFERATHLTLKGTWSVWTIGKNPWVLRYLCYIATLQMRERNVPPGESLRWVRSLACFTIWECKKTQHHATTELSRQWDKHETSYYVHAYVYVYVYLFIHLFIYLFTQFYRCCCCFFIFTVIIQWYRDHIVRYTKRWYVHISVPLSQSAVRSDNNGSSCQVEIAVFWAMLGWCFGFFMVMLCYV